MTILTIKPIDQCVCKLLHNLIEKTILPHVQSVHSQCCTRRWNQFMVLIESQTTTYEALKAFVGRSLAQQVQPINGFLNNNFVSTSLVAKNEEVVEHLPQSSKIMHERTKTSTKDHQYSNQIYETPKKPLPNQQQLHLQSRQSISSKKTSHRNIHSVPRKKNPSTSSNSLRKQQKSNTNQITPYSINSMHRLIPQNQSFDPQTLITFPNNQHKQYNPHLILNSHPSSKPAQQLNPITTIQHSPYYLDHPISQPTIRFKINCPPSTSSSYIHPSINTSNQYIYSYSPSVSLQTSDIAS